ncbi:MAG: YiiD C-terminal domain-containing protein [Pseudomonadales bacterium]
MTELNDLCTSLQTIWHEQIPLSKAMDMQIVSFADNVLTCRASLGPNVNVHGTAFAGSLYAVQALTGWGMVHLQLQLNELDASIVIANGCIDYATPVAEDIVVQCSFGEHEAEMEKLKTTGKARFQLACNVLLDNGSSAGGFSGLYAVRLNR